MDYQVSRSCMEQCTKAFWLTVVRYFCYRYLCKGFLIFPNILLKKNILMKILMKFYLCRYRGTHEECGPLVLPLSLTGYVSLDKSECSRPRFFYLFNECIRYFSGLKSLIPHILDWEWAGPWKIEFILILLIVISAGSSSSILYYHIRKHKKACLWSIPQELQSLQCMDLLLLISNLYSFSSLTFLTLFSLISIVFLLVDFPNTLVFLIMVMPICWKGPLVDFHLMSGVTTQFQLFTYSHTTNAHTYRNTVWITYLKLEYSTTSLR